MKKIALFWVFMIFCSDAGESMIDRTGYHMGVGGSGFIFVDEPIVIPTFDLSLEYGLTQKSTILLEHHGYLVAGLVSLEYKYYLEETSNTFYLRGGAIGAYALDYGAEINTGVFKVGAGYAWKHLEWDICAVCDSKDIIPMVSLRYKF